MMNSINIADIAALIVVLIAVIIAFHKLRKVFSKQSSPCNTCQLKDLCEYRQQHVCEKQVIESDQKTI